MRGGSFIVRMRMKTKATGAGAIYFNKPASAERMPTFQTKADGEWHEYDIAVPADKLDRLRIDPARSKGVILIDWIRLLDAGGKERKVWNF
ncbi:DUF1080 domain-containing protein [Verrucomicrobiales bacterium]|nr:DUF1080 domain-containing protein [Verrucomicrobiales bacterium]